MEYRPTPKFVCILLFSKVIFLIQIHSSRDEAIGGFKLSVLMEDSKDERQVLGFMELNGPDFYGIAETRCGV
jgi:hypothetical protein